MQVTETLSQGLKREFKVVLPATELEERLTSELATSRTRCSINGFRPGKVPVAHLRKVYGRSVMADVVQNAVNEANRKIVDDNGLKLALEPQVQFPENKDEVEQAHGRQGRPRLQGRARGAAELRARRPLRRQRSRSRSPRSPTPRSTKRSSAWPSRTAPSRQRRGARPATGDRVVVDFVGRIDGERVRGRQGRGHPGRARLGLLHSRASRTSSSAPRPATAKPVKVTFPENYGAATSPARTPSST